VDPFLGSPVEPVEPVELGKKEKSLILFFYPANGLTSNGLNQKPYEHFKPTCYTTIKF
jgi:hypothetical protein